MGKFQKTIENFVCENCGQKVEGAGYTNHCPRCLWSMHVDITPGDREEVCKGLMKPIRAEKRGKDLVLTHKCVKCGFERKNKVSEEDNFNKILKLMNK